MAPAGPTYGDPDVVGPADPVPVERRPDAVG